MAAIKFGIVQRPKQGRHISGDAVFVHDGQNPGSEQGRVLVAVIDGLGAGEGAAEASGKAVACIRDHLDEPLAVLVARCHRALRGTRGAVMTLMRIDLAARQVSFVGVGNVGVRSRSAANAQPISGNGIVGFRLPTLREFSYNYTPGDLFVLFTDGVSHHFTLDDRALSPIDFRGDPQGLADAIAARYGKPEDDVTVVVVW